jgi:hypothetical protein
LLASAAGGPVIGRRHRPCEIITGVTVPVSTQREPELVGQTVVVIGGSAGIGLETARQSPR